MELTDTMMTKLGMGVGIPIVLLFLFFIIWDLAKESKAGRFGTVMMFIILGGGFFSYMLKEALVWYLEHKMH